VAKLLRSGTPIPIELTEELWITQDEEGHYLLGRPDVTFARTGKGAAGLVKGIQKVIAPGTQIMVILP
jgi:hypothetical protein